MYSISNIESSFYGVNFAKMNDTDFKNYIGFVSISWTQKFELT